MIPQIGQSVKCVLVNNAVVEGTVEYWQSNFVKLRSLDGANILLIHHPSRDIVLTKIIMRQTVVPTNIIKNELEQKFQEEYNKPSDDEFRTTNLAQLKIMLVDQEKKIIAEKLKEHRVGDVKKVEYGYPNLRTLKSPK